MLICDLLEGISSLLITIEDMIQTFLFSNMLKFVVKLPTLLS